MKNNRLQLIALINLVFLMMTSGDVRPQPVIIRVSADGSLVIQEKYGASQRPRQQSQIIELVESGRQIKVLGGSSRAGGPQPLVTRGRVSRQDQPGPAKSAEAPASDLNLLPPAAVPEAPIAALIDRTAQEHGVDPGLVRLVVQKESNYNPQAVSPQGAMGLMQLMPGTASLLGVRDPFNPAQNIDGGVRYLKLCLDRFNNNVALALAAYNAGPESVARYQGVPPFAETKNYVADIIRDYTGQAVDLTGPPGSSPVKNPLAGRRLPKKPSLSLTDLQPLFLAGGERINVIQSGRSKVIEIVSN